MPLDNFAPLVRDSLVDEPVHAPRVLVASHSRRPTAPLVLRRIAADPGLRRIAVDVCRLRAHVRSGRIRPLIVEPPLPDGPRVVPTRVERHRHVLLERLHELAWMEHPPSVRRKQSAEIRTRDRTAETCHSLIFLILQDLPFPKRLSKSPPAIQRVHPRKDLLLGQFARVV